MNESALAFLLSNLIGWAIHPAPFRVLQTALPDQLLGAYLAIPGQPALIVLADWRFTDTLGQLMAIHLGFTGIDLTCPVARYVVAGRLLETWEQAQAAIEFHQLRGEFRIKPEIQALPSADLKERAFIRYLRVKGVL
jgi:hypothetical protein